METSCQKTFFGENFSYLFLAKSKTDRKEENIPGIGNKSHKFSCFPSPHPFHRNDRKGSFSYGLKTPFYLYPVYKTWCPFISTSRKRKGWTVFNIFFPLSLQRTTEISFLCCYWFCFIAGCRGPGMVDKIWFPFHQKDSKGQQFRTLSYRPLVVDNK